MAVIKIIGINVGLMLLFAGVGQLTFWVIAKLMDQPFKPPGYIIGIIMGFTAGQVAVELLKRRG